MKFSRVRLLLLTVCYAFIGSSG